MGGSRRRRQQRTRKPRYASLRRKLARAASAPDLLPPRPELGRHHDFEDDDDKEGSYARNFFDILECDNLNSILGPTVDLEKGARPALEPPFGEPAPGGCLARKALKGRERWEFCNGEEDEGEGSSCDVASGGVDTWWNAPPNRMLRLKLDYEEIMTAWSDKGPLFVDREGAQVVPQESHHHSPYDHPASVFVDVGGGTNSSCSSSSNLWAVPENGEGGGGGREARVMRYREKRRSRLFSRSIRYEVRKLNAEKRPRIKGRFVKRADEDG